VFVERILALLRDAGEGKGATSTAASTWHPEDPPRYSFIDFLLERGLTVFPLELRGCSHKSSVRHELLATPARRRHP
jgi:hypothetical protein